MLTFIETGKDVGDRVVNLSAVTWIEFTSDAGSLIVEFAGGGRMEMGPREGCVLLEQMAALARSGVIKLANAPATPRPVDRVVEELSRAARAARPRRRAATPAG